MTITTKKAANINEAIQIINSLLPNGTFEFVTENYSDDYTVTKRHFSGTNEHGATCYKMIEFVTDGKLQTVRFINTYRDTAIDIIIENFIAGTQDAATDAEIELANQNDAETDGSEEDDFSEELPALFPAEDNDDDDELNLTAATRELELYNICRKAMNELWKEEAA